MDSGTRVPLLSSFEDLFVVFVRFDVVVFIIVRDESKHGAGFGEVEAVWGGVSAEDYVGGVGFGVEAGGVHGGELEAVEEGGGALGFDVAGGEGVDDDGEGDLDGLAVFEGGELDVLAGDEIAAGSVGVAEAGVAAVEAGVEVAVEGSGERRGLDWRPLVLMWRQSVYCMRFFSLVGYPPPGGTWLKAEWLQGLSEIGLAKFVQPLGL